MRQREGLGHINERHRTDTGGIEGREEINEESDKRHSGRNVRGDEKAASRHDEAPRHVWKGE